MTNFIPLKCILVKAIAKINNLKSADSTYCIVRNLSRILDVRILNIDLESRTIHFVYDSILAFEKVKLELMRIGYPISQCSYQEPKSNPKQSGDTAVAI